MVTPLLYVLMQPAVAISRQCLDRRIPDRVTLDPQIQAWQHQRNQQKATVECRFSASDARHKLERSYPQITH